MKNLETLETKTLTVYLWQFVEEEALIQHDAYTKALKEEPENTHFQHMQKIWEEIYIHLNPDDVTFNKS